LSLSNVETWTVGVGSSLGTPRQARDAAQGHQLQGQWSFE